MKYNCTRKYKRIPVGNEYGTIWKLENVSILEKKLNKNVFFIGDYRNRTANLDG